MNALERTLATVRGEPRDRLSCQPIFMTLAARLIGASYEDYVRDWRVLTAAQLALAEQYGIEVVSCCSDAWRESADCGALLTYYPDAPPACREHVLADKAALRTLRMPKPEDGPRMSDRVRAVERFVERVKGELPVLGWVEGPVAESVDLRGMNEFLLDTYDDVPFALELMDRATELETAFALAQVRAGADVIGLGDAAASLLSAEFYREHAFPRAKRLVEAIQAAGALVRLHVCGNTNHLLEAFGELGAELVELDYPVEFGRARERVGPRAVLMGNMDPVSAIRNGTPEKVRAACAECHRQAGERYILAAGCEIPPDTPETHVRAMVDYARTAR